MPMTIRCWHPWACRSPGVTPASRRGRSTPFICPRTSSCRQAPGTRRWRPTRPPGPPRRRGSSARGFPTRSWTCTAQWLHYGYLQQGRFARAQALADSIDALYSAEATDSMPMHVHMYRTMMGVETVVETGHWDSVPPSPLPSRGAPLYRTARSAYHRGDRATVDSALARYRRLRDSLALAGDTIQPAMHAME